MCVSLRNNTELTQCIAFSEVNRNKYFINIISNYCNLVYHVTASLFFFLNFNKLGNT